MKVLWGKSPLTLAEIVEALQTVDSSWHPKTAQTLIGRLVKKGALGFEEKGRSYLYSPQVTEQECVDHESRSFMGRIFGGSLKPMLVHFAKSDKLSAKDLAELQAILDAKRKEKP